jgi:hypothetical protein
MKLKQNIVDQINSPEPRKRIAAKLPGTGEQALYYLLKRNMDNGRLTKMDALLAIAEETGIHELGNLLDSEPAAELSRNGA